MSDQIPQLSEAMQCIAIESTQAHTLCCTFLLLHGFLSVAEQTIVAATFPQLPVTNMQANPPASGIPQHWNTFIQKQQNSIECCQWGSQDCAQTVRCLSHMSRYTAPLGKDMTMRCWDSQILDQGRLNQASLMNHVDQAQVSDAQCVRLSQIWTRDMQSRMYVCMHVWVCLFKWCKSSCPPFQTQKQGYLIWCGH